MLDLVRLLYPYADTDTVHTRLDEDLLILVACNSQWVQEDLGGACSFYLWDIVSLRCL
jgi:hypothetical protein